MIHLMAHNAPLWSLAEVVLIKLLSFFTEPDEEPHKPETSTNIIDRRGLKTFINLRSENQSLKAVIRSLINIPTAHKTNNKDS